MTIRNQNATEAACLKVFNRYRRQRLLERMTAELSVIASAGSELKVERIRWLPSYWQRLYQSVLFPMAYLLLIFAAVSNIVMSAASLVGLCVQFCIPVRLNIASDILSVPDLFRALDVKRVLDKDHALLCIEECLVIMYGAEMALEIGFTQKVAEVSAKHAKCQVATYDSGSHISFIDPMQVVMGELEQRLPSHS
tara:strand:+ start:997 stop:1581 length:585 start_codon:yes stop_codon:yes gene_type:complete